MSLGHDIEHITVSRFVDPPVRVKNREEIAMSLSLKPEVPLVLHWDGKLLPSLADGRSLEERVAVLVSGEDTEELLGVPVSADGTGQAVAENRLEAGAGKQLGGQTSLEWHSTRKRPNNGDGFKERVSGFNVHWRSPWCGWHADTTSWKLF
ncbi:hypothetical protein GWK47_036085 [Chionoecetes opilio]|uniref:Uncharacterized protein n=1 Tax=Chionoecetes opilio TaxID=41210 RepID=A0A8J4YP35_CHIOP|nr:hypothetical protein GWK47_036085 [Chionoecetes opilio]